MENRRIYVVVTQTGTILSRILKLFTRARYNHASVSYDATLETMYSFGRLHPYNPFFAGFVREGRNRGTFKRFRNTEAVVIAIPVTEEMREEFRRDVVAMYGHRADYEYNYVGLFMAAFGVAVKPKNAFYCSEFVRYILLRHALISPDSLSGIVHPSDFLRLRVGEVIYRGKLRNFRTALSAGGQA